MSLFLREAASIWPVVALWFFSLFAIVAMTCRILSAITWRRILSLLKDDSGSAYSISYLLTLPLYMLFIALFIELSFIMVCKTGTVYAAFAAARAGIVWSPDNPPSQVDAHVARVARRAFVPFASGLAEFRVKGPPPADGGEMSKYLEAYTTYNDAVQNDQVFRKYVAAKYRYSLRSVDVQVRRDAGDSGRSWDENFSVTVSYAYPFGTLGIGSALGKRGPDGFHVYPMSSTVTLKTELPRNDETSLGIQYLPLP